MGMWTPIASAPSGVDLELAVLESEGVHALAFSCRRQGHAWVACDTGACLDVTPTHWRAWSQEGSEIARRTREARRSTIC